MRLAEEGPRGGPEAREPEGVTGGEADREATLDTGSLAFESAVAEPLPLVAATRMRTGGIDVRDLPAPGVESAVLQSPDSVHRGDRVASTDTYAANVVWRVGRT